MMRYKFGAHNYKQWPKTIVTVHLLVNHMRVMRPASGLSTLHSFSECALIYIYIYSDDDTEHLLLRRGHK